jgi:hypothetical protein
LVRSQHGAQTWLGSSPTPVIILFQTAIFTLTLQLAHVIELFNQHDAQPVGTNPVNLKKKSLTSFFFLNNRKFNFKF